MSFFKPPVNVYLNITSPFSVMTHDSSVIFRSNMIYFDQKEPIKAQALRVASDGIKSAKFFMSFFKAQVSFSSKFASFFSVVTHNSSVLLWLKHNILSTKVAHQSANFQTYHCSHKNSPNSSFLEPKSQFFFKLCVTLQYHET